jgi:hypothetical protein
MPKEFVALKPCPRCGLPVKIKWIAGCSREIALAIRHPYGGKPTWYIKCARGMEMAETVRAGNKKEQDKIQNKLIKEWNRQ